MRPSRRQFAGISLGWITSTALGKTGIPIRHRRYRADAVILLLSFPLYRRENVGGGEAAIQESSLPDGRRVTLHFAAGSNPARAHGFNRVGWIREEIRERERTLADAVYFGVLTASPEENLEQARQSLVAPSSSASAYTAIDGRSTSGRTRSAIARFSSDAPCNWSDRRLLDLAHASFGSGEIPWQETRWPGPAAPMTFLYALSNAMRQPGTRAEGSYVYHERPYRLELEKHPDPHAATDFSQRGLIGRSQNVLHVRGKVRNQESGRHTLFQLWMEDAPGAALPLRIEFQPRSFLRLSFEALPETDPLPQEDL